MVVIYRRSMAPWAELVVYGKTVSRDKIGAIQVVKDESSGNKPINTVWLESKDYEKVEGLLEQARASLGYLGFYGGVNATLIEMKNGRKKEKRLRKVSIEPVSETTNLLRR